MCLDPVAARSHVIPDYFLGGSLLHSGSSACGMYSLLPVAIGSLVWIDLDMSYDEATSRRYLEGSREIAPDSC